MRLIIAGSRDFNDYKTVKSVCDVLLKNLDSCEITILCGCARGADTLGEHYAKERNIKIEYYKAQWDELGNAAGFIRNEEMAKRATHLVAFWDGASKGTKHMINLAKRRNLKLYVHRY